MIRAYKFKLRPSETQVAMLDAALEVQRGLYNDALRERRDLLENENKHLTFFSQKPAIARIRAAREEVRALPYPLSSGTYKRLDEAWKAFRKRWAARSHAGETCPPADAGLPRFIRYSENNTLTYDGAMGNGWEYLPPNPDAAPNERKNAAFRLAPFGVIRCFKDRPVPEAAFTGEPRPGYKYGGKDGYKIATVCEVTRDERGWWVSVIVEDAVPAPTLEPDAPCATLTFGQAEGESGGVVFVSCLNTPVQKHVLPPSVSPGEQRQILLLQRRMARQLTVSRERGAGMVSCLEKDETLSEEARDHAIRCAKKTRTNGYAATRTQKARLEKHGAERRKQHHILLAHAVLSGLPPTVKTIRYELGAIEPLVRHPAAIPDAESAKGFHRNGAARKAERTKALLGCAWYAFAQILTHEAAERGLVVERIDPPKKSGTKRRKKKEVAAVSG